MPNVEETLAEREKTHGKFADVAKTSQRLKDVLLEPCQRIPFTYSQLEALDNICQKMARIVNGDNNHVDSWHDIAGYATLIERELEDES